MPFFVEFPNPHNSPEGNPQTTTSYEIAPTRPAPPFRPIYRTVGSPSSLYGIAPPFAIPSTAEQTTLLWWRAPPSCWIGRNEEKEAPVISVCTIFRLTPR